MPGIYRKEISSSSANFNSYPLGRKTHAEENINNSDIIEKIAMVNNSPDTFHGQSPETPGPTAHKGFWYYFIHCLFLNRDNPEHNAVELDIILAEGRALRQDAEEVAKQLQRTGQVHPPTFSLKTKLGLLIGTVLLMGGGVGLYMRRTTVPEASNDFNSDDLLITAKELTDDIHADSRSTLPLIIPKRVNRHYPNSMDTTEKKTEDKGKILKSVICIDDENFYYDYLSGKLIKKENQPCSTGNVLFPKYNSPSAIDNQLPPLSEIMPLATIKSRTMVEMNEQKSVAGRITINSYQNNDQTLQRCRNRLIGYINAYIEVPKNAGDKDLAQLMLALISRHSFHESRLAQIYLYGTGLYGEKIDEHLSINVQRQLVGELLSQLMYGKSLDEYLLHAFSLNRYILIKDFKLQILKNNYDSQNGNLIPEMSFFYEKYIVPTMPIFSLKLSKYSDVLFGSITWLLIYLSSEAEWLDIINDDEQSAIMYGIDILNSFINEELSKVSKSKIEIGMKFSMLYLHSNMDYQKIPDFKDSWNTIRDELVKRVDLSYDVVKTIGLIISGMKEIKGKSWGTINEFTDQLLVEYCHCQDPDIYIIKDITPANSSHRENTSVFIDKDEFINSIDKPGWCLIENNNKSEKNKYDYFTIKIPIVKKKYNALLSQVIYFYKNVNELFIRNNFVSSDYFNPSLDGGDIEFINAASLEVVLLQLTEHRFAQTRWIGPPLKKIQMKSKYIFFSATHLGEQRIYALDKTYKKLMQRVKIDSKNLKEDIGEFFDGWSDYNDGFIKIAVYKDSKVNISTSTQESSSLFLSKVVEWQNKIIEDLIYKHTTEVVSTKDMIINIMKDLFIPFYSCITSLQREDVTDAFISCFLDGIFIVFPAGKKLFSVGSKMTDKAIDFSFMVNKNKIFKSDGRIIWSKVVNDFYIYNTIMNEQTMLRISVVDVLIGSIDPGIGLIKDIKNSVLNIASTIIKGELIRLPFASIRHMKNIAEFSVRTQSIFESSKKIAIKISKPSGRLTMNHYYSNGTLTFSVYDSFYQFGDYYAYYSNRNEVDILLGITEEITEDGEHVHVTLSEDEYSGIIFRVTFEKNKEGELNITPWFSATSQATKIIASDSRLTNSGYQMIFIYDKDKPLENLVFYPEHQCHFSSDGFSADKIFDIFKIDDVYYILDPENKNFRPVYDGDYAKIINRDKSIYFYNMIKNEIGDVIINSQNITRVSDYSPFAVQYSLSGNSSLTKEILGRESDKLHFLSGKLFFYRHGLFYEVGLSTIKNQFMMNDKYLGYPSIMIGWDSLKDDFIAVKPYLKKSSSHVGEVLESFVYDNCTLGETLEKFPTLLLSGAISSKSETKLRVSNYYYPLEVLENNNFYLKCSNLQPNILAELYYDLFTESFELISSNPKNGYESPYDRLINQYFSKEKYPEIMDLVDFDINHVNDKLAMRLRQAAFLKRLNPIERLDTLQLPVVQIYSWKLHHDAQPFQRKYPAAALWMTWQRQLHLLLKNKSLNELMLIEKIYLKDDKNDKLFSSNNRLANIKYTDHEAIWIDNDDSDIPHVLSSFQRVYKNDSLISENGFVEWFPRSKYANAVPVTQFMYEKNIHPKIMINTERNIVKVINSFFEDIFINRYSVDSKFEYFIISPNRQWMVSIDNKKSVLFYDLYRKDFGYTDKTKRVIYAISYSRLKNCASENYFLFALSDSGVLFCPKNNLWVDNNSEQFFWSAPTNFSPAFISQEQRFLGFKNKDNFNIILYDMKREKEFLLTRPSGLHDNGNITAVSFSAMNAVLAVAFDDGHIYLYDLIQERQESTLSPMAHVKLNNTINNKSYNNILMRFEGVFDSLTIIHPEGRANENKEQDDIVFTRSRYGFHGAV